MSSRALAIGAVFAASTALTAGVPLPSLPVEVALAGPIGAGFRSGIAQDAEIAVPRSRAHRSIAFAPVVVDAPVTVEQVSSPALPAGPAAASVDTVRDAPPTSPASPRTRKQAATSTTSATTTTTAPAPPTTTTPPPPRKPAPSLGFDTCEAPSVEEMHAWKVHTTFQVAAIYIGGPMRQCRNAALDTPDWVRAVVAQGWRLMPTYVGPQAPCTRYRVQISPQDAHYEGRAYANDAVDRAAAAGLPRGAPIYYDLENFVPVPTCVVAVQLFLTGWTQQLHAHGYLSGLYSNLDSGIAAAVRMDGLPGHAPPDAVWVAAWNNISNLSGFPQDLLPDWAWANNQRAHQFWGDHDETWGGVTLNVDRNVIDAPTWPLTTGS